MERVKSPVGFMGGPANFTDKSPLDFINFQDQDSETTGKVKRLKERRKSSPHILTKKVFSSSGNQTRIDSPVHILKDVAWDDLYYHTTPLNRFFQILDSSKIIGKSIYFSKSSPYWNYGDISLVVDFRESAFKGGEQAGIGYVAYQRNIDLQTIKSIIVSGNKTALVKQKLQEKKLNIPVLSLEQYLFLKDRNKLDLSPFNYEPSMKQSRKNSSYNSSRRFSVGEVFYQKENFRKPLLEFKTELGKAVNYDRESYLLIDRYSFFNLSEILKDKIVRTGRVLLQANNGLKGVDKPGILVGFKRNCFLESGKLKQDKKIDLNDIAYIVFPEYMISTAKRAFALYNIYTPIISWKNFNLPNWQNKPSDDNLSWVDHVSLRAKVKFERRSDPSEYYDELNNLDNPHLFFSKC